MLLALHCNGDRTLMFSSGTSFAASVLAANIESRAISCSPFLAAMIDEASSGSEVPTATMIRSRTPNPCAISTAPQTKMRELTIKSASRPPARRPHGGSAWRGHPAPAPSRFPAHPLSSVVAPPDGPAIRPPNTASNTMASRRVISPSQSCHGGISNRSCSTARVPCSSQHSEANVGARYAQVLAYRQEQLPRSQAL